LPHVQAAQGDHELLAVLLSRPEDLLDRKNDPLAAWFELGHLAGCYGEESIEAAVEELLVARLNVPAEQRAIVSSFYRQGVRAARDESRGVMESWVPSEASHLCVAWPRTPEWTVPPSQITRTDVGSAELQVRADTIALQGDRVELSTRLTPLEPDEFDAKSGHLLLASPGVSELCFRFRLTPESARAQNTVNVRLHAQKGLRQLLPNRGRALIEVFLDGAPMGTRPVPESLCAGSANLTFQGGRTVRGEHEIRLRLSASSTTTARLWRFQVSLKLE
jgi:hypothetical protein